MKWIIITVSGDYFEVETKKDESVMQVIENFNTYNGGFAINIVSITRLVDVR